MTKSEYADELNRLRRMIDTVRAALLDEDVEAAILLHQMVEHLMVLSEVAEAAVTADRVAD